MIKKRKEPPIFIDALSFAQERKSGIGHISEEVALALAQLVSKSEQHIFLVVPIGKAKYVKKYVNKTIKIKTIFLPARLFHLLNKLNVLPPLDLFLGRGNYIFPNYRNWRLMFSKSLTYIHDLSFYHYEEYVEPKNLAYLRKNIPVWIKRADAILTASNYTKEEITKYLRVDPNKIYIVPHGVNAQKFLNIAKRDQQKVLRSYGISCDKYILHVGNIEPRKNIKGLVKAYSALSKKTQKEYALVLVGGGGWLNESDMETVRGAVESGVRILRPDKYVEDDDLPMFYASASSVVMPSFYEGFGVPPLQAMVYGIPTVVSDNSSLRELFGEASILVDPHSIKSIKEGIEKSLRQTGTESDNYRKRAKKIVDTYTWLATAKEILRIIEKVNSK